MTRWQLSLHLPLIWLMWAHDKSMEFQNLNDLVSNLANKQDNLTLNPSNSILFSLNSTEINPLERRISFSFFSFVFYLNSRTFLMFVALKYESHSLFYGFPFVFKPWLLHSWLSGTVPWETCCSQWLRGNWLFRGPATLFPWSPWTWICPQTPESLRLSWPARVSSFLHASLLPRKDRVKEKYSG